MGEGHRGGLKRHEAPLPREALELGKQGDSVLFALEATEGAHVPLVQEVFRHDGEGTDRLLESLRALPRPYQQIIEVTRVGDTVSVTLERFVGVQGEQIIAQLRAVDRLLPLNAWGALARTWLEVVRAQDSVFTAGGQSEASLSTPDSLGVDLTGRLVLTPYRFNFAVGELQVRVVVRSGPAFVPSTMSPDSVRGATPLTEASRVYSVAASLVRLLTGEGLFEKPGTIEMCRQIISTGPMWTPRRHPEVDEPLAAVLTRALALHPEARFATLEGFAQALDAALPPPASFIDAIVGLCAPAFRLAREALSEPRVLPFSWRAGGLAVMEDRLLERAVPIAALPSPTCAPLT